MTKITFTDNRMAAEYTEKLVKTGFFSVAAPALVSKGHFHQSGNEVYVYMGK
jgi:hypothetical protein